MHKLVLTCSYSLLCASMLNADTLLLKGGNTVEGTYMGGDSRNVRFAAGSQVSVYSLGDIASIRFAAAQQSLELPAGTQITVRMIDNIDSVRNDPGSVFRASIDQPVLIDGREVIRRGSDAVVTLVGLEKPGHIAGAGSLTLRLKWITVDGKAVDVTSNSVITKSESRGNRSAKVIGGTAALGALIGGIAGGGRGAAIGAGSGAAAGTLGQVLTSGPRVKVPAETQLTFSLQEAIKL
jgi:hypothetical protein